MGFSLQRLDDTRSTIRLAVSVLVLIVASHYPVEMITEFLLPEDLSFWQALITETLVLASITGSLLWRLIVNPLRRSAAREHEARQAREADLRAEAERQRFDATVHRALEMAESEQATMVVLQRAFAQRMPERSATLLLADSSDSHLAPALQVATDDRPGRSCTVEQPRGCPAIRQSRAQHFTDSRAIDACPHLTNDQPTAALCIPMNAAGRAVGVLHSPAPVGTDTDPAAVAGLERLVTQTGARLGLLRVVARTTRQAATDPLTGLMNRRVIEERAADLLHRQTPLAIAMGDLDHFKELNDAHGHEAGDRALRLFSMTLSQSVRKQDLVARYGGEEFLVVFPNLTADAATAVLQRCQEELLVRLAGASVPGFTASYGVADTSHATDLEGLIATADQALFTAKRRGRNRIVVNGDQTAEPTIDADADARQPTAG